MIMTAGTPECQPEKRRARRRHAIDHSFHAILLEVDAALKIAGGVAMESGGDQLVDSRIRQQIASDLLDGKPIERGNYRVEWDGSGPAVQVKFLQGKQTVATLSAHLTEQPDRNPQDAYSTAPEPDGSTELTAIYPGGKRVALQFEQSAASGAGN